MPLYRYAAGLGITALVVVFLVVGQQLLIPFAIAIMTWFLIDALALGISSLPFAGKYLPTFACKSLAVIGVISALGGILVYTGDSLVKVVQDAPMYQHNLERLMAQVSAFIGIEETPSINQLVDQIEFGPFVASIASELANGIANAGLVLIYLLFLLMEHDSFDKKIAAIFGDDNSRRRVQNIIAQIGTDIRQYIWIKTLMSLVTGVLSLIVLMAVGIEYASFWALLIFLLNYIPVVGSLIGVLFPALLALVQFESLTNFFILVPLLTVIQIGVGNILEPKLMGSSLNLSAIVVLLSLAVWGSIWGIAGMFLSVPITVFLMIIFSNVPQTRAIAIILSSDGDIKTLDHE
ncbi:MAG: AI-2E family transporter [Alphaproteobacteria bacterium]|nr:MAG: AI-2E family transporter [Alphaproteobacteria bacterium]